MNEVRRN